LLTGANGLIGRVLRRELSDRYDFRLMTRSPIDEPSHVADIADLEAIAPAFEGVAAVVHLAAASAVDSDWQDVLPANIVGAYNVFEAARRQGVEQVVYASTSHVVGMYEREAVPDIYDLDDPRSYDADVALRPDSLYGASKGLGELIGRLYVERHGLRVICLRIGMIVDDEPLRPPADRHTLNTDSDEIKGWRRTRTIWISQRDCAQLFDRALSADDVGWAVVYGTSDNPRQIWDLRGARQVLGYRPQDSAPE
jgi:NAD+ dependent glucose-6-phosphate dehydrogenase